MESNSEKWTLISQLFSDLADLDPQSRLERLSHIGREDPAVRAAVEALLAADEVVDERLSRFDVGVSQVVRTSTLGVAADSTDPLGIIGKTISQFRIRSFLASGGMGIVYEADDTRLNRPVALKFPLPHHRLEDRMKARFIREAQAAGALDHPNLCPVYDVGESEHGLFLAMPLYRGKTLKQVMKARQTLPVNEALGIAQQIASGLAYAHAAGVIHRDLKPGNIMQLGDGTVKILDFGLARTQDVSHTKSEVTLGTVSYMAPEQIRGSNVDARADLWSLGVILYEMLAGRRPFTGDLEASVAHSILHDEPQSLSGLTSDLPPGVSEMVRLLLQKDASVRYSSAGELLGDFRNLEKGDALSFRPAFGSRAMVWGRRHRLQLTVGVAAAMTAALVMAIPRARAAMTKPTHNAEAYDFFLRARDYERLGPPAAAESLYLRALELDTGFALARARLAIVYAECQVGGSRDCFRRGEEYRRIDRKEQVRVTAERALKQAPNLADAHFAMGLYWELREEPERAIAEFNFALRGLSRSGALHAAMGRAYRSLDQWVRAIEEGRRAIDLDPADPAPLADLATTYSRLRRYDESARLWNQYLVKSPDAYTGAIIKGNVYLRWLGTVDTLEAIVNGMPPQVQRRMFTTRVLVARLRGKPEAALAALDDAPRVPPQDTTALQFPPLMRAQVYVDMGDSTRARAWFDSARTQLEELTARKPDGFRTQAALGLAYAGLGRTAQAKAAADSTLALMRSSRSVLLATTAMKSAAEVYAQLPAHHDLALALLDTLLRMPAGREASVPLLRVEPAWIPLRSNPAFQAMLDRHSSK